MSEKFKEIIQSETPTLVDFYADWCGPCKMQSPILKEVKNELGDQIRILKVNIDKNQSLSTKLNVRGVPTLILYKNGTQLWRESGLRQKQEIIYQIKNNT